MNVENNIGTKFVQEVLAQLTGYHNVALLSLTFP